MVALERVRRGCLLRAFQQQGGRSGNGLVGGVRQSEEPGNPTVWGPGSARVGVP